MLLNAIDYIVAVTSLGLDSEYRLQILQQLYELRTLVLPHKTAAATLTIDINMMPYLARWPC